MSFTDHGVSSLAFRSGDCCKGGGSEGSAFKMNRCSEHPMEEWQTTMKKGRKRAGFEDTGYSINLVFSDVVQAR